MARYLTVERQYGSGGSIIAKKLGLECSVPCFSKEILETAAKRLSVNPEDLVKYEEKTTNSFLYSIVMIGKAQSYDPNMLMKDGRLFVEEQQAIRSLSEAGSSIFVGHCAANALKDRGEVVRVFIKSSYEARKKRIGEEYGIANDEIDSTIKHFDKKRASYYWVNTAKKWTDPSNYDIVLDSSTLGINGCVNALKGIFDTEHLRG